MASTDIRSMLQALETVTTQTAANATDLAAQGVTLADVKATAVVEKNFTLQMSAFILEGSVYRASIAHNMNSTSPGVAIYDNDRDLQLAEFIAVDANNAKVELTASQRNDSSFPFTVNLQAKNTASMVSPRTDLGNGYSASLSNGTLRAYFPDGTNTDDLESGIIEAYFYNLSIHTRNSDGSYSYYQQPSFGKQGSNSGNFQTASGGTPII